MLFRSVIREDGEQALLEGQFFLNTATGRDHFETVKEMGGLMEWSYGYDVVEGGPGKHQGEDVNFLRKLRVHEVSPVLLGAGIDTGTLAVKEREPFPDELARVLGDVTKLTDRVEGWGRDTDGKEGRTLSAANRERLALLVEALGESGESLMALLEETDPNKDRDAVARVRTELVRMGIAV